MSIDAFTSPMGPSAVLTRLNEIVTALNGVTGAADNVVEVTHALYPEWHGSVWTGVAANGSLDVAYEGTGGRVYYDWSSTDTNAAEATVVVKWRMPDVVAVDLTGPWVETDALQVALWTTDAAGASMDLVVRDGASQVASVSAQVSSAAWSYVAFDRADLGGGWAAGDEMSLEFTLDATGTDHVRVGEVLISVREVR